MYLGRGIVLAAAAVAATVAATATVTVAATVAVAATVGVNVIQHKRAASRFVFLSFCRLLSCRRPGVAFTTLSAHKLLLLPVRGICALTACHASLLPPPSLPLPPNFFPHFRF